MFFPVAHSKIPVVATEIARSERGIILRVRDAGTDAESKRRS